MKKFILLLCLGFISACEEPVARLWLREWIQLDSALLAFLEQASDFKEPPLSSEALELKPQTIALADSQSLTLNLPEHFEMKLVAQGFHRPRFMAKSPDGRLFLATMHDLSDNRKGEVLILENFDPVTGRFAKQSIYLNQLRNPNSVAFYRDSSGRDWLYIALTERLIRYRYQAGDAAPAGEPETLATFPDYGLSYKYGGWHLTRTIAFSESGKLYVSVGSSCNACEEKEEVRASILEMDPDGKNSRFYARGMRNAVGLSWAQGHLYASNMGQDKLGDDKPEDNFYKVESERNYGWPYCYEWKSRIYPDPAFADSPKRFDCKNVPLSLSGFAAHSAPLGVEYFPFASKSAELKSAFLVALHGSAKKQLGRGYRIVRVRPGHPPQDFITGFLQDTQILGRPAGILRWEGDAFFFTDDFAGRLFYVSRKTP